MRALKLGGSALEDAGSLGRAVALVGAAAREAHLCPVVVSAFSGVTDALLEGRLDEVRRRHLALAETAGLRVELPEPGTDSKIERLLCGELWAVALLEGALSAAGLEVAQADPGALGLITDEEPERARPLAGWRETMRERLSVMSGIVLVPGFHGRDRRGRLRLLGRNSGDLSAAYVALALDVEELVIVARYPGIATADPVLVPEARPLDRLSHDELEEIVVGGAPVMHLAALRLLRESSMPLLFRGLDAGAGTRVASGAVDREHPFRALVHRPEAAGADAVARSVVELVGQGVPSIRDAPRRARRLLEAAGIHVDRVVEKAGRPALELVLETVSLAAATRLLHREFCAPD